MILQNCELLAREYASIQMAINRGTRERLEYNAEGLKCLQLTMHVWRPQRCLTPSLLTAARGVSRLVFPGRWGVRFCPSHDGPSRTE